MYERTVFCLILLKENRVIREEVYVRASYAYKLINVFDDKLMFATFALVIVKIGCRASCRLRDGQKGLLCRAYLLVDSLRVRQNKNVNN